MSVDLYELTVPHFSQGLGALQNILAKGRAYAEAQDLDENAFAEARLVADMFPLRQQVGGLLNHSVGALRDIESGAFSITMGNALDYAGLESAVAQAIIDLQAYTRERVNACAGRDVVLDIGSHKQVFSAEALLLSLSFPNYYFHLTTAYDILRVQGVPLGKMDFLGQMRTRLG